MSVVPRTYVKLCKADSVVGSGLGLSRTKVPKEKDDEGMKKKKDSST